MRRRWLLSCLPLFLACSDAKLGVGLDKKSWPGNPIATAATELVHDSMSSGQPLAGGTVQGPISEDTAKASPREEADIEGWLEREHPGIVLRCEAGKIGAYVVTGLSDEGESGEVEGEAVRIELDSPPDC